MSILRYDGKLKPMSQKLRRKQTKPEYMLWYYLRKKQILNIGFTRQKPIGPYIVDFYSKEAKLVIELDGSQHYTHAGALSDQKRDQYLRSLGLSILRFNNLEVLFALENVIHIIECNIQGKPCRRDHGEYIIL